MKLNIKIIIFILHKFMHFVTLIIKKNHGINQMDGEDKSYIIIF